ncbi:pepsin-like aspartic protease [Bowmanella dokdonensis]|uniref:A1 family peptidase n=1 Tax=Bowmanella dokdonensis TaxID=751969 RepID=A0A939DRA6_9ALTE|nr:pepsin-like aspartic protease [Bowmanella dokdonensis]MBN7827345.1 A1 family peptidase [Bowmanella dokdonensis]
MQHSVRIPLNNTFAKGGYCARVHIGQHQHPVNLVLDTGSSTLAVHNGSYQPERDDALQATSLAQDVIYGKGGWYGPVVNTTVSMGLPGHRAVLDRVNVAVTAKEQAQSFIDADGILGLAYEGLNPAYDIAPYLQDKQVSPALSYPFLMDTAQHPDSVRQYREFLHQYPRHPVTPYFTQLEEHGVVANQFALLTHRSSVYQTHTHSPLEKLTSHHLNHGLFVLGKPKLHLDLYHEPFHSIKVLDDKYYNVDLLGLQLGETPKLAAPKLAADQVKGCRTNAIVDSGSTLLVLPPGLFDALMLQFYALNPGFKALLAPFQSFSGEEVGIPLAQLNLKEWPPLYLDFTGEQGQSVRLTLSPQTYWQIHAPQPNQAYFKLTTMPSWPNQSILGLPLLNNYYCLFDRSASGTGAIRFAAKRDFSGQLLGHLCQEFST